MRRTRSSAKVSSTSENQPKDVEAKIVKTSRKGRFKQKRRSEPNDYSSDDSVFESPPNKNRKSSKSNATTAKATKAKANGDRAAVKKSKKKRSDNEDSSSESDIAEYLHPVDEINLNSEFFNEIKPTFQREQNFESLENNIFAGITRLSDESSESDPEDLQLPNESLTLFKLKPSREEIINQNTDNGENHFDELKDYTDYTNKIAEAKREVEKYHARKKAAESKAGLDNIQNLLAAGERNGSKAVGASPCDNKSFLSSNFESCSETESNDWEEVLQDSKDNKKPLISSDNLEIVISSMPEHIREKKGHEDFLASMKRRLNRIRKQNQLYVHKVHLLCWLAHGNYINSILNRPTLKSLILSLIPSKYCFSPKKFNLKNFHLLIQWYKDNFTIKATKMKTDIPLHNLLIMQLFTRETFSKKYFVYLFICLLRALGIECRLVLSMQVEPIRPPSSELHSLSAKEKSKKNDDSDEDEEENGAAKTENLKEEAIIEKKKEKKKSVTFEGDISGDRKPKSSKANVNESNIDKISNLNGGKELYVKLNSDLNIKIKEDGKVNKKSNKKQKKDSTVNGDAGAGAGAGSSKIIKDTEKVKKNKKVKEMNNNVNEQKRSLRTRSVGKEVEENPAQNSRTRSKSLNDANNANASNKKLNSKKPQKEIIKIKAPPSTRTTNTRTRTRSGNKEIPQLDGCCGSDSGSDNESLILSSKNRKRTFSQSFRVLSPVQIIQLDGTGDDGTDKKKRRTSSKRSIAVATYKELDSEDEFVNLARSNETSTDSDFQENQITVIHKGKPIKIFTNLENSDSDFCPENDSTSHEAVSSSEDEDVDKRLEILDMWAEKKNLSKNRNIKLQCQTSTPCKVNKINPKLSLNFDPNKLRDESDEDEDDDKSDADVAKKASKKKKKLKKVGPNRDPNKAQFYNLIDALPSDSEGDSDFACKGKSKSPAKCFQKKSRKVSPKKRASLPAIDRRILSSESESEREIKRKPAVKNSSKPVDIVRKKGFDVWVEVFIEADKNWLCVDVTTGQVNCISQLHSRASQPISYIMAWNNNDTIKDVTRRYCPNFHTFTRKLRVDNKEKDRKWWTEALRPFVAEITQRDKKEEEELNKQQLQKPLPVAIYEYKDHPLYVLKRHLLKYQAIYPPDAPTLGFVRGEGVYSRDCVQTLHTRDHWYKKFAKTVKPGEKPYKVVRARPRWDRFEKRIVTDEMADVFGHWQVKDYEPPTAENGIVPKNEYGNVELFQPCMLPKKTVVLKLPGLNKICRRMGIDYAPAFTGFEHQDGKGWFQPKYEGFVVCEEFEDTLVAAWELEQEEQERREREKLEKRVYDNWKKIIKGVLIREKLKAKYNFGESAVDKEKKSVKTKPVSFCTKKKR